MPPEPSVERLLSWLVAVPAGLALLVLFIMPRVMEATMVPVHGAAAEVPGQPVQAAEPRWAAAAEAAERRVRDWMVANNLPGLALAVGVDGELAWAQALGWADVEAGWPVTADTLFRIGDLSIVFTAAAVDRWVAQGRLDLDAPLARYLPGLAPPLADLTLRQVMSHTAGFRAHGGVEDLMRRAHCESVTQALAGLADAHRSAPGGAPVYSVRGWVLVSAVIERLAGVPFAEYMAQAVYTPLGLQATRPDPTRMPARIRFAGETLARGPGQAQTYWPRAAADPALGLELPDVAGDTSCLPGAADLLSTPVDLVRFAQASAVQTTAGHDLAWRTERVTLGAGPTHRLSHPGHAVGGSTVLHRYPELGLEVAVSTNVSYARLTDLAEAVAAEFLAARTATVQNSRVTDKPSDPRRPAAGSK